MTAWVGQRVISSVLYVISAQHKMKALGEQGKYLEKTQKSRGSEKPIFITHQCTIRDSFLQRVDCKKIALDSKR
jgi:hypothetical protein